MFKVRFRAWDVHKNLQPEEVLALLQIKAFRKSRGAPVEFSRYGQPISSRRLERFLREHPELQERLKKLSLDEVTIDKEIQNYLPSRGLAAFTPRPSRSLQPEEALCISESAAYALRTYHDNYVHWNFQTQAPESPPIILTACDNIMSISEATRKSGWRSIKEACDGMPAEILRSRENFTLDFLWLLDQIAAREDLIHLTYQLTKYVHQLFEACLGPTHPYTVLFSGAEKLIRDTTTFKHFQVLVSEALVDAVVDRLMAGTVGVCYRPTFFFMYNNISQGRQQKFVEAMDYHADKKDLDENNRTEVTVAVGQLQRWRSKSAFP